MIRIIGGERKGKKLKSLSTKEMRPLMARVKQSLFDILGPELKGKRFLDLYAGIGSVGLEALSRGASRVVFVEKKHSCLNIIKENINICNWEQKTKIIPADVLSLILKEQFDIIFSGPPYKLNLNLKTIEMIEKNNLLAPQGIIICQHHIKEELPQEIGNGAFILFRQEKYGKTILSFYKRS